MLSNLGVFYALKRNPKPIRFSIFFSKAQKNLNCPNSSPIVTKSTWYIGKIKIKRTGVNQIPMSSFVIPSQIQKGFESQADADPVIAKTINIIVSW